VPQVSGKPAYRELCVVALNGIGVVMGEIVADSEHVQTAYSRAASVRAVASPRRDDYFFSGMAIIMLASVFSGFTRTYFFAGLWNAPLPNRLIHVHGAAFVS